FQCALDHDETAPVLVQESRLRARLAAVGVETGESDADDGDAGLVGDDLTGGPDRVAESALRKFRFESVVGVEMRRGLNDVRFDLKDVRKNPVARLAFSC